MAIEQTEVEFVGHILSSKGMHASEEKVEVIRNIPPSIDVTGVRRLCGVVQYLVRFTPNPSRDLVPIHKLKG